jgi:hypothetical protein
MEHARAASQSLDQPAGGLWTAMGRWPAVGALLFDVTILYFVGFSNPGPQRVARHLAHQRIPLPLSSCALPPKADRRRTDDWHAQRPGLVRTAVFSPSSYGLKLAISMRPRHRTGTRSTVPAWAGILSRL